MRVPVLLFLLVNLLTGQVHGQTRGTIYKPPPSRPAATKPAAASPMRLPLEESAEEIKAALPQITDDILFQDSEVVRESLPTIQSIYSRRGFSNADANSAALYGWRQLRTTQLEPTAALSSEVLINHVSGFGKLIIRSKPIGAIVVLDGHKLPEKTEAVAWPSAGTSRIKLTMNGYQPVEETCAIEEGKPTLFQRNLKPLKRKPVKPTKRKNAHRHSL